MNEANDNLNPTQLAEACAAALWAGDRAARDRGITVDRVDAGVATLSLTVAEDMVNGHDLCHGGYIFMLADTAFAYACNSENHAAVASGARIEFLAPARLGDRLTATARRLAQKRTTGVYDIVVTDQAGRDVALFRGNAHRLGHALVDPRTGDRLK